MRNQYKVLSEKYNLIQEAILTPDSQYQYWVEALKDCFKPIIYNTKSYVKVAEEYSKYYAAEKEAKARADAILYKVYSNKSKSFQSRIKKQIDAIEQQGQYSGKVDFLPPVIEVSGFKFNVFATLTGKIQLTSDFSPSDKIKLIDAEGNIKEQSLRNTRVSWKNPYEGNENNIDSLVDFVMENSLVADALRTYSTFNYIPLDKYYKNSTNILKDPIQVIFTDTTQRGTTVDYNTVTFGYFRQKQMLKDYTGPVIALSTLFIKNIVEDIVTEKDEKITMNRMFSALYHEFVHYYQFLKGTRIGGSLNKNTRKDYLNAPIELMTWASTLAHYVLRLSKGDINRAIQLVQTGINNDEAWSNVINSYTPENKKKVLKYLVDYIKNLGTTYAKNYNA